MTVFLTGATGFLGMEVLARLLERGDEVIALVRAEDREAAEERLDGVLATLWRDPKRHRHQVRAVAGDVTRPGLGLGPGRAEVARQVDCVVHCAASISFSLPYDEAREINVEGTRRAIDLAFSADARLVHVSTAYVAGTRPGRFRERQLGVGQDFRNTYEQTKCEAEQLVAELVGGQAAIARPSIVVGDSTSGWTPAFNVLYWPLRAFSRGLFDSVPALPSARVDVVPVDHVADGIVALVESDAAGAHNLVSGDLAPTATELLELASRRFGRPTPPLVEPGTADAGAAADGHGAVYLPYFDMDVVFDDTRGRALVGGPPPRLATYFDRLIDFAEAARWGKRTLNRQAAREGAVEALAA